MKNKFEKDIKNKFDEYQIKTTADDIKSMYNKSSSLKTDFFQD